MDVDTKHEIVTFPELVSIEMGGEKRIVAGIAAHPEPTANGLIAFGHSSGPAANAERQMPFPCRCFHGTKLSIETSRIDSILIEFLLEPMSGRAPN